MMRSTVKTSNSNTQTRVVAIGVASMLAFVLFFIWPRSSVELSDHGYELATALYRVCNQQSVEGLAKIEQMVAEAESDLSKQSSSVFDSIIAHAKSGRWSDASIECRKALEDQVQR